MTLNRYAKRKDANQAAIVSALRKAGVTVYILDTPVDLLVNFRGYWGVMEIKSKDGRLTPRQAQFLIKHPYTPVVTNTSEALAAMKPTLADEVFVWRD